MDARKSLSQLRAEWQDCTRCELGVRRQNLDGRFVFGEGSRRSIMFIGEGPGVVEEDYGRPFVGPSGKLLRDILSGMGLVDFYITNLVSCRSCVAITDEAGNPRFRQRRGQPPMPMYKDEPPLPVQIEACRPRLFEEIYLVDPLVIVTLGGSAAEAVLRRKVAITNVRGMPTFARIPGATHRPVLTEKKKLWPRVKGNEMTLPVEPNEVEYHVVPTLHPAFVLRKIGDKSPESPFRALVKDIFLATRTYERYVSEIEGRAPAESALPEAFIADAKEESYQEETKGEET